MSLAPLLLALLCTAPPEVTLTSLEDGTSLLHVKTSQDTAQSSFRLVVRAGGFQDPDGREGLAHLMEHLVFQGTYDTPEGGLLEAGRRDGAVINAFTSSQVTAYSLDAPHSRFLDLMRLMASHVTNPSFQWMNLDREKQVILAEQRVRSMGSLMELMETHIYREHRDTTLIGTRQTRAAITQADLLAFFQKYYRPSNMLAVVVTPLPLETIKTSLQEVLLLAPAEDVLEATTYEPAGLPVEDQGLSWVTAAARAYRVEKDPAHACQSAAILLEMRLQQRLMLKDGTVSELAVRCHPTRGEMYLTAVAFAAGLTASNVNVEMGETISAAPKRAPTPEELEVLARRTHALSQARLQHPAELAMELAYLWGNTPKERLEAETRDVIRDTPATWEEMRPLLQKALVRSQSVQLHFSPFQN